MNNVNELIKVLEEEEQRHGKDSMLLVPILDEVAYCLHTDARYAEAESYYRRSLSIHEKTGGCNSVEVLRALDRLGVLLRIQNKLTEAEPYYKRALETSMAVYGPDHLETATRQNYLAGLHYASGNYDRCRDLTEGSLRIYRAHLGERHIFVACTWLALALIDCQQGLSEEAAARFRKCQAVLPTTFHGDFVRTSAGETSSFSQIAMSLFVLACENFKQGRLQETEVLFRHSVIMQAHEIWPTHPFVAENLHLLADLYRAQKMYPESESLYRKALELRLAVLGATHLDVSTTLHALGKLLHELRRVDEAAELLEKAVNIRRESGFPPVLASTLQSYAAVLREKNEIEKAAKCDREALDILEKFTMAAR